MIRQISAQVHGGNGRRKIGGSRGGSRRGYRSAPLCRRAAFMPRAGAGFRSGAFCRRVGEGCPRAGRVSKGITLSRDGSKEDWRSRGSRRIPLSVCLPKRREGRGAALPVCFEEALFLLLDLRPPGRGRGDVMGLRPLRSPLPTPRSTPLALAFAWASLWPGQFLRKTDRATSHSAIAITLVLRAEHVLSNGLQGVMFPGEELREYGALSRSGLRKGPGSSTSGRLFGKRKCGPWPLCG